MLVIIKM